jgi:glycosyltransferase involved in cell wall biosynthesis
MSISIVIPVYNEEENINGTFKNLINAIKLIGVVDYEIIFINDCSTDSSAEIIKKIKDNNENIILINNRINIGQGQSVKEGINLSKKEYAWWVPGDDNLESEEIIKMLKDYYNFDFILTKHIIERSFFRKFVSEGFTILVNILFNKKVHYYNCVHLVKNDLLKKIKIKSISSFWGAEMTLKILSLSKKYKVETLKLNERQTGKSNIFNFRQVYLTLFDLIKYRLNLL